MQKFIVTITDPGEPIVNDENAVCHVLNSELPAARLKELIAELRRIESLILVSGPGAVSLCREQNLDGVVAEINVDAPYKKQILPLREALGHKKALGVAIPLSAKPNLNLSLFGSILPKRPRRRKNCSPGIMSCF